MPVEIERKFLVKDDAWRSQVYEQREIRQGYMANNERCSVRVRVSNQSANINIKSMTYGVSRAEYEYPIPVEEAHELLNTLCKIPLIEKTRYLVKHAGKVWEIDEFAGDNQGLTVAEIELESESESFELPAWVDREVSTLERYYNMRLTHYPFKDWSEFEQLAQDVHEV
ncbi:MAG: Adenylate cyclase [uncultured Thiotrichaceae bacterium]|uniref:Adenylate cyclase n=1 Tax=uncultured Thiotrichaceae bacterium TaxID=298394 RepID=A0A6S6TBG1_9GAMM|nr:MAG: Adenylate cyclase [uncultured Thiotrichaceae bacterium]